MSKNSWINSRNIFNLGVASCDMYEMKPGGFEKKHYHKGFEIVYVLEGSCKTHKKGHLYFYGSRKVHEVINDSEKKLSLLCLTIPPESSKNTIYI